MLKIRDEQLDALRRPALEAFIAHTAAFLRAEADEAVAQADDAEVRALILQGLDQAATYGIVDPYCIQQYILFMAWVGADFAAQPWATQILRDARLSQLAKISRLEDYILSEEGGA